MHLTALALTSASIATTVLAAGAPPITTTTASATAVSSTILSFVISSTSTPPKPLGTGAPGHAGGNNSTGPQHGRRPLVHIVVEAPAADAACDKGTNTTIQVPIDGVYTNQKVLAKVAALYLTGVSGNPGPKLEAITCVPYLKENGTGTTAGNAFTYNNPTRLTPQVGTPNHIGSIFCTAPLPAGGMSGGGMPPNGGGPPGGNGNGAAPSSGGTPVVNPPAPAPTPVNPTVLPPGSPPPPAQSSVVPASGVADMGVPALMSAALVGVLGIMLTL